jgi:hypothetical protein
VLLLLFLPVVDQVLPDKEDSLGETELQQANPTVDSSAYWKHYPVQENAYIIVAHFFP